METHGLGFLQDAPKRVNEIVMVLIRLEDIEARKDELVFLLNELVQELHIVWVVVKVVARE